MGQTIGTEVFGVARGNVSPISYQMRPDYSVDIHFSAISNYRKNYEGSSRKAVQGKKLRPLRSHLTKVFETSIAPPQTEVEQLEAITAAHTHRHDH